MYCTSTKLRSSAHDRPTVMNTFIYFCVYDYGSVLLLARANEVGVISDPARCAVLHSYIDEHLRRSHSKDLIHSLRVCKTIQYSKDELHHQHTIGIQAIRDFVLRHDVD